MDIKYVAISGGAHFCIVYYLSLCKQTVYRCPFQTLCGKWSSGSLYSACAIDFLGIGLYRTRGRFTRSFIVRGAIEDDLKVRSDPSWSDARLALQSSRPSLRPCMVFSIASSPLDRAHLRTVSMWVNLLILSRNFTIIAILNYAAAV